LTMREGVVVVTHDHPSNLPHEDLYVAIRNAFRAARRQLEDYFKTRSPSVDTPGGAGPIGEQSQDQSADQSADQSVEHSRDQSRGRSDDEISQAALPEPLTAQASSAVPVRAESGGGPAPLHGMELESRES
jgi:hypothetical protein